jgi:hypothetical protein
MHLQIPERSEGIWCDDLVVVLVWLRQIVMSYMQGMMSMRKRHMEGPFPRIKSPNFGGSFMQ